jgi:hypothetical protein
MSVVIVRKRRLYLKKKKKRRRILSGQERSPLFRSFRALVRVYFEILIRQRMMR